MTFELRDLFTVAQFIKTRCAHGLKAPEPKAPKNYIFYDLEILDAKKTRICVVKVEPKATIWDIKCLIYKNCQKWHPSRQSLTIQPYGESLQDDQVLGNLPVGTSGTLFFHDLGPQLGWAMVFLAECFGPLIVYLLFYFRLPNIYLPQHNFTSSPFKVVKLACVCHSFHYIKRLFETIFIHRFSHGTMPIQATMRNCLYYWGFAAWLAYHINHPLYTPPSYGKSQVYIAFAVFVLCEAGNFSIHMALNHFGCNGSRPKSIPYPTTNPFTWPFVVVSCPNYTYEVGAWLSFSIMTQCAPVAVFTLVSFIQMTIWARQKHGVYTREFINYPELRRAIVPLFL